jgi:hypothetical protein
MTFEADDYSMIVKNRAKPPNPWRWEIHRAGKNIPVERSDIFFPSMTTAQRAGKAAFALFLANRDTHLRIT